MEQREIGIGPGKVAALVEAPISEIRLCRNELDAARLMMRLSPVKRHEAAWAEMMGISPSTFNEIMNNGRGSRVRNPPPGFFRELQRLSQTDVMAKFYALQIGRTLTAVDEKEERRRELLAELEALENAA
jgi:hypothetical protein